MYSKPGGYSPSEHEYTAWITQNEPSASDLYHQRQTALNFNYRPLISVVTPVYNPPLEVLEKTISSVLNQTYSNWELCLVDGGSTEPAVIEVLDKYQALSDQVHLKTLERNQGISANTNIAIELAKGEFLAFLDHDDLLAPNALYEVVKKLNEIPDTDVLYSDHDLISSTNDQRINPLFKPNWSPEIMLSANYITHLTVVRTALARDLGGFRSEYNGAQDWDLYLRISERTDKITHIPKILYHWRDNQNSTAGNIWSKDYAPPAQLLAIKDHLKRQGHTNPDVFFTNAGHIRVSWKPKEKRKVSIIIPSKGYNSLIKKCIHSILRKTDYNKYEIVIVNNGDRHPDEFTEYQRLIQDSRITVVHFEGSFNYSAINNYGAKFATGTLLLFLNNDTEVLESDWLDELVMWADSDGVGAVGAKLLKPNGSIQHAGVIIGLTGFAGHMFMGQPEYQWTIFGLPEWYRNYLAVTSACMMIKTDVFERIGGYDESFIMNGSDVEICLRLHNAGLRVVYNPFVKIKHVEGATREESIPPGDFQESFHHYFPYLESGDPFYNPNLSYWHLSPTLVQPGEKTPLEFTKAYTSQEN
ncbi:glycosyltransferase [Chloroflexota bacterium]